MNKNTDQKNRIIKALNDGRMIYDTGRKRGIYKIYETLNPNSRKVFGLEPLENILPNWREYLPKSEKF